jgi:group I intron endonuclease
MLKSGIYKIQSKVHPDRCYIGSAVSISMRWRRHRSDLNKNKHHSVKLQRHHNKYGLSDLVFSVVERCSEEVLIEREQYYIDELDPFFNIYKIAGSPLGMKRSKEARRKMSEAAKGRRHSKETRKKIGEAQKGKKRGPRSKGTIRKMSENRKNKVPVLQLTKEGLVVNVFESINDASRKTGAQRAGISKCLNGKQTHAGGWGWKKKTVAD